MKTRFSFNVSITVDGGVEKMDAHELICEALHSAGLDYSVTEQRREGRSGAVSDETKRGYASDWKHFAAFCLRNRENSLPADSAVVARFIREELNSGKYSRRTILHHLCAVNAAHIEAGHAGFRGNSDVAPAVKEVECLPADKLRSPAPIRRLELRAMLNAAARQDSNGKRPLLALRDRVLLLLLWELRTVRRCVATGATFEALSFPDGGNAQLLFSDGVAPADIQKQDDPETCCVLALSDWKLATGLHSGPILRSVNRHGELGDGLTGTSVQDVVRKLADKAGIRGRVNLRSFRKSTTVSPLAIVRTGIKGLPNSDRSDDSDRPIWTARTAS